MIEKADIVDMPLDQRGQEVQKRREIVEKIIITALTKGMESPTTITNLVTSTLGSTASFEYVRWVIYELKSRGMVDYSSGFNVILTEKGEDYLNSDDAEDTDIELLADAAIEFEQTKRLIGAKLLEFVNGPTADVESINH